MQRKTRAIGNGLFVLLCLTGLTLAQANAPARAGGNEGNAAVTSAPTELTFMKGDTHDGTRVHVRIVGDTLHFRQTNYSPSRGPIETERAVPLTAHRRRALNSVLGELPRYRVFGSCFGRGMKYYMVETPQGKFYRSLPEHAGKCYADEPGIWSLFEDLDDLVTPPNNPDYQEYSAAS